MTTSQDFSYLDDLNPQQRAAVEYHDGPSLVIAGAGSGKTRVLTYKIVDLLAHGYEPWRILALTFTNKAAREMKERVAQAVGANTSSRIWMGTFHSIFLRLLRSHADLLGYRHDFTIYDTADSRALIKTIIKDMALDEKVYKPATIQSIISNAKNALIYPKAYLADKNFTAADKKVGRPMTGYIYSTYVRRCKSSSAMDFDDILYQMNVLLRDFPDICRHYQEFFRYILVDEYQDTNFAQHLIITRLAGARQAVCVVGDDAQSIYSFRGANIDNILSLDRSLHGLRVFKLERNYRSTQNIINAAGSLIEKNTHQMPKNVYSENEKGEPVCVVSTYSDFEEAFLIANRISQMQLTYHDSLDDYAVLYRTNAQSRQLEESLRKRSIPYRIYGGLSFYQRKEVKDAVSYFRLAVNPDDDEALRRIINYPSRGIGETTMKKLSHAAIEANVSIWTVIQDPSKFDSSINKGTLRKLESFKNMISEFVEANASGANARELGSLIFTRTGMITLLEHDRTPESISRKENLEEILRALQSFVDQRVEEGEENVAMTDFLSEVMLATDQDQADGEEGPKVTLMTVHAAKGLEFGHIFIAGVEEELFPSAMAMDSLAEVEEERRLLYVAITRAKQTCVITFANSRFRNGATMSTRPSRFLHDIDKKYLRLESSSNLGAPSPFINPLTSYGISARSAGMSASLSSAAGAGYGTRQSYGRRPSDIPSASTARPASRSVDGASIHTAGQVAEGMSILHGTFGRGDIVEVGESASGDFIVVEFDQVGRKKLLLRFANFKIEE